MRITGGTRVLAILGDPVGHTLSPLMHNAAIRALGLNAVFVALRIPRPALAAALSAARAAGLAGNATLPLKEDLLALVDRPTDLAARAGACNTFWTEDGVLVGDNTDVAGVLGALDALGAPHGGTWLAAGTGGAARAVALAAGARDATIVVRSRSGERTRQFVEWAASREVPTRPARAGEEVDVAINATPLGLQPDDPLPVEPEELPGCRLALDLVYRRGGTRWVAAMARHGARVADGRVMLVEQGVRAFERFFPEVRAPREVMRGVVDRALRA